MNVLVTGATGFIGSHLCEGLIEAGYTVFGLSHSGKTENVRSLLNHEKFHLELGDIKNRYVSREIIEQKKIKAIVHLAAQLPTNRDIEDPFPVFEVNARGSLNLLNAAYLNNVNKFVYASSMSVYSEPPIFLPVDETHPVCPSTVYGISKLEGEHYCNAYSGDMKITILRYGGAYGMGQPIHNAIPAFIDQALHDRPVKVYGDGTQTSDFVYVKDVVHGTMCALESDASGVYNIGSGEEMSVKRLAECIIRLTNSKSELVVGDMATDRPFRFALDTKKSRKDLEYSPHSVEDGLAIYLSEYHKVAEVG